MAKKEKTEKITKPHINLMICTPGHSMIADYVKSILAAGQALNSEGISWGFATGYSSHVGDAREVTLSGTMINQIDNSIPFEGQITYDKLLWIDSDIMFTPDDVFKLYHSDKDIITGAYIIGNGEVTVYPEEGKKGFSISEILEMDKEPVKVSGAGFGFICVKSGVFEKLSRPWFQSTEAEAELNGKMIKFQIMGEDISWCKRVRNLGYDIWFDPTVKLIHQKTMKLTWEGIRPNV
jgi:hypothetical protein